MDSALDRRSLLKLGVVGAATLGAGAPLVTEVEL